MSKTNFEALANTILEKIGGKDNVSQMTHCMTRLRLNLKDESLAKDSEIKSLKEVSGVVKAGGQYQIVIGPDVVSLYDKMIPLIPGTGKYMDQQVTTDKIEPLSAKKVLNNIMGALAGCMTPLIPILLSAGFSKAIVAVLGPSLLNVIDKGDSLYTLFTFVGDAGFYFLPVFLGYTAAVKFGANPIMGLFLSTIMIHPTFMNIATKGIDFNVYGIPVLAQNYSSTVIPVILSVWVMSHVEKFFKKKTPATLKVFAIPFGTLLVMLPLALCILGPAGAFIGTYVGNGIIALHDVAGPFATAILAGTFGLLVMTGMHPVLFAFLFVSFPKVGYDAFMIPAMIMSSYSNAGVAIAAILKVKNPDKKRIITGYLFTWLIGGVGEPMLYGLNVPYRTPLYASIVSGAIAGLVAGLLGLKAYILNTANGIYAIPAFFGGPTSNYIVLGISLFVAVAVGFIVMWFMKLDETIVDSE